MTSRGISYVGIDLSGPVNIADTSVVSFAEENQRLVLDKHLSFASDDQIITLISDLSNSGMVVAGIDAPLSYNPGGGDRPGDKKLREVIVRMGMRPGSIMPPTLTRMVYLTLRGVTIASQLRHIDARNIRIAEVHPGAAMALRGASLQDVVEFKRSVSARKRLFSWLVKEGLYGADEISEETDHTLAACAAALAAWKWHAGKAAWMEPAAPPHHPFDYVC
jgi:predicted nuclease with RNAse H fold